MSECWLCEGLGGVAIHLKWTERRGKTLLTPHEYPSDDDHETWPCPACELRKGGPQGVTTGDLTLTDVLP